MEILLAEDEATSRLLLSTAIEGLGHDCVIAHDGIEAWERFRPNDTDVIISDWMMPGMDGDELCRRVRSDPDAPYTYFILVTALEDQDYVLQGMRAGADDYLVKPLNVQQLETRLIAASRVTALHRRLRERRQQIENEVELAASIQRGLLPAEPPRVPGCRLAGRCVPAANVGGDYYDFLVDEQGRLFLLIADVAGHSIGAALLMAMARSVLRREISQGSPPSAVLRATNEALYADLVNAGLFITMFCARFDPASGELCYASAGHNPPLLRRADGAVIELDADGAAIGILESVEFEQPSIEIGEGDMLLLYTDGVVEASDGNEHAFGEKKLADLVAGSAGEPDELADQVYAAVGAHRGDADQEDDVTVVALGVGA